MSKKSTPDPKIQLTEYSMSVHMGICHGPIDRLRRIFIGEKIAFGTTPDRLAAGSADPSISETTTLSISKPNLHGGERKEGGAVGRAWMRFGGATQTTPSLLASKLGRTTETTPGFRGLLTAWFTGSGSGGFIWGHNTPYLKPVWFEVERVSCEWLNEYAAIVRQENTSLSLNEDFSSGLAPYSAYEGSLDAFSIVSDDYGAALQVEPGPNAVDAIVRAIDSAPLREVRVKFKVTATAADDYGVLDFRDAGDNVVFGFVAGRQASLDALRRPNVGFLDQPGNPGNPIGSASVTVGQWYEMRAVYLESSGLFSCSVVDLSDNSIFGSVEVEVGERSSISKVIFRTDNGSGSGTVRWDDLKIERGNPTFDRNPAHIIYECLTNTNWGMGGAVSGLDLHSFEAAAITLYDEQFGLSLQWAQQSTIEAFVDEIKDHIQGHVNQHPRTGLLTLKLIRGDYDVEDLPTVSPDNATLSNWQRKGLGETINEIIVRYTDPESGKPESVAVQDLALISTQGLVSETRDYLGVRRRDLAIELAHRDLSVARAPLATCDAVLDRTMWELVPGDVVKLTWPEHGILQQVFRVGPVDDGGPGDSSIKVSLAEDIFGLDRGDFTTPPGSEWEDPSEEPTAIDHYEFLTVPYWTVVQVGGATAAQAAVHPESAIGLLAAQGGSDTSLYDLLTEVTGPSGASTFETVATRPILSRMELADALEAEAETVIGLGSRTQGDGPAVGGFVWIGTGGDEAMELALVTAVTDDDVTVKRGVLDTVPVAWPAATPVWFLNSNLPWHDPSERAAGETAEYKILPHTSLGLLEEADAALLQFEVGERPHLPSRPADVKVEGVGYGIVDCTAADPIDVTVAERNRLTEDSQVLGWTDATVTPETGQTWKVELLAPSDRTLIDTVSALTGTSTTIAHSVFAGNSAAILRMTADRDGFESLQGHEITAVITGPTISGAPVTTAEVDVAYDGFTVSATGGLPPYAFSVTAGTLPPGITLDPVTGEVAGTPTEEDTFSGIVITVTDAAGLTDSLPAFEIVVGEGAGEPGGDGFTATPTAFFQADYAVLPFLSAASYPHAEYIAALDKTFIAWEAVEGNEDSTAKIISFDHAAVAIEDAWSEPYIVGMWTNPDDAHGQPVIHHGPDSHFYCFFGSHASAQLLASSVSPNDIRHWNMITMDGGGYTYPKPNTVGSAIHCLWRKHVGGSALLVHRSGTPFGGSLTFGSETQLVDFNAGSGARVYVSEVHRIGTALHFTARRSTWTDTTRQHVYYFIYETTTGALSNIDGSVTVASGSLPVNLTTATNDFRIVENVGSDRGLGLTSLAFDTSGNAHITYGDGAPDGLGRVQAYHVIWDGSTLSAPVALAMVETGTYVALVPGLSGAMEAWYHQDDDDDHPFGGSIMCRRVWDGSTWAAQETMWTAGAHPVDRPFSIRNAHPDMRVAWCEMVTAGAPNFDYSSRALLKRFVHGDSGYAIEPSMTIQGTPVLTAAVDRFYAGFTVLARRGAPTYTYSLVGTWPAGIGIGATSGEVSGTPTETGTFTGLSVRVTDLRGNTADLPTFTLTVSTASVQVLQLNGEALQLNGEDLTLTGLAT